MGTYDNIMDLLEVIKSQGFNYYIAIIDNKGTLGKEKVDIYTSLDGNESKELLKQLSKKTPNT